MSKRRTSNRELCSASEIIQQTHCKNLFWFSDSVPSNINEAEGFFYQICMHKALLLIIYGQYIQKLLKDWLEQHLSDNLHQLVFLSSGTEQINLFKNHIIFLKKVYQSIDKLGYISVFHVPYSKWREYLSAYTFL